ncbi:ATP-binding protein [Streptomyces sp. CA-111067]|uniref:ATP-binding protein n=1 Tax=Streptomyces sp. CA-111067 TaxID=3240046 RepID=UPI003D985483
MPEWPGRSLRDRAIESYAGTHLVRSPGPLTDLPALLLLGPRGSGKTSLLGHLGAWGQAAPLATLDLAAMEQGDKTLFDALADLAYQLQARKDGFPQLGFPSFTVLLLAAAAAVNTRDRGAAVNQMRTLLQGTATQDYSYESLQPLLESVAGVAGGMLPGWVTQIVPLIRSTQRLQARTRINRRVARAARDVGGPRAGADFLVGVNRLFRGYPEQQKEAQRLLLDAFLADLRDAYLHRSGHQRRTAHCLLLLDNVDSDLGESFLQLLLDVRRGTQFKPARTDPLLIVSAARHQPESLIREERRLAVLPDYDRSWSGDAEKFTPVPVGRLHVGLLRDLNRDEVEEHAGAVLAALPEGAEQPAADTASYWLGWVVHGVTRGQPAATAAVLDAVSRFPAAKPWDERIREWPLLPVAADPAGRDRGAATVADATLDLLLTDCDSGLRTLLPRAAAALSQGQAEAAPELWRHVPPALRRRFEDDGQVVYHPAVRFLLLRRLDATAGVEGAGTWDGAHSALAAAAGADGALVAYHELARGRLDAAVDYLHARFHAMPATRWCDELSLIQRAPARWAGGLPEPARDRYVRLVGTPTGDEGRQAITRLLAAGWVTAHPRTDPHSGVYEDPLGDPYAELYYYIAEEFRTLRRLTRGGEADRDVFDHKVRQYERKPW